MTAITGLRICYAFLYLSLPRSFWFIGAAGLALGITASYKLDLLPYVYMFVLVAFVDIIRLLVVAASRRKRVLLRIVGNKELVWAIFVGLAGGILLITYQILMNVGLVTAVAGFDYPYLFGILFFLVPVSATYLFFDFAQIHRKLELMNLHLEKRVERRTQALEVAMETAADANKAKSRFLANVSHEIRTPMNAILGYAQVLQRSHELAPDHRAAVETIHSSGNHLLNLLDDVLELSKIESGRLELHPWDFDLTFLLDSVESMIVARCSEKGLGWRLEWAETKPLWVHGDESKLAQVLINLLSNAARYTREGEIALEALRIDRDRYRFTVKDTGPGITDRDQPMLYVAFEQGPAGIDRGGAGLGLAIAQRYVELMGGELNLDSQVGKGSSFAFSVSLPAGQEGEVRGSGKTWSDVKNLAPGFRVDALVVDDDQQSSAILTHLLDEIGAAVDSVHSGQLALAHLGQTVPDVVFLDIHMPEMDGRETLRRIRARPEWAGVQVVAVSASVLDFERREALAAGFDAFIGKPFRFEQVYACLAELLDVEYVHDGEAKNTETAAAIDWSSVELSAEFSERLREAVTYRRVTQMESCFQEMEQLSPRAGQLAARLRALRKQHRMDDILELLQGLSIV